MNSLVTPFVELFRYKDLLYQLVSRDLKLKYRRSFLGYLWSILSPLLIMGVQSLVFMHLSSVASRTTRSAILSTCSPVRYCSTT